MTEKVAKLRYYEISDKEERAITRQLKKLKKKGSPKKRHIRRSKKGKIFQAGRGCPKAKPKHKSKVNEKNVVDYIMAFEGEENFTDKDAIDLFSHLLKTGQAWRLQGMYGRTAKSLIEAGYLKKDGTILKYPPEESKKIGRYVIL